MFNKQKIIVLISITVLMVSSFLVGFGLQKVESQDPKMEDFELFWEVLDTLQTEYVKEIPSTRELIYGAIRGMLSSLDDDYTRFMDPEAFEEFQGDTKGEFGGVGIQIEIKNKKLVVVVPLPDTPAYKAGLKSGDWIIKINGKPTYDMAIQEAITLIRGEKGTKVTLTILHLGGKKPKDYTIIRDIIKVRSVEHKFVDRGIGYVKISLFNENTNSELEKAIKDMRKGKLRGLIIDLRSNPGGLLESAIEVSDRFISSGPIVQIEGRKGKKKTIIYAEDNDFSLKIPIVVLVNGYSASASEIVAGALQDYKLATIIGCQFSGYEYLKTGKTFGKGSVQTVHPLRDNSGIAITTAKYLTAKGRDINGKGITPDIIVKLNKEDIDELAKKDIDKKSDSQLRKAKEVIKEEIGEIM